MAHQLLRLSRSIQNTNKEPIYSAILSNKTSFITPNNKKKNLFAIKEQYSFFLSIVNKCIVKYLNKISIDSTLPGLNKTKHSSAPKKNHPFNGYILTNHFDERENKVYAV
jgi:hypothetical protein